MISVVNISINRSKSDSHKRIYNISTKHPLILRTTTSSVKTFHSITGRDGLQSDQSQNLRIKSRGWNRGLFALISIHRTRKLPL